MARVLIVGCGCAGTQLGKSLAEDGWAVRGTSRVAEGAARIEAAGLEGVIADPDRVGTVLEHVGDVAIVVWALAAATGPTGPDVNGPRLERMLERIVDTPVRGFVLEASPEYPEAESLVATASETWQVPARSVAEDRGGADWAAEMHAAVAGLIGEPG